MGTHLTSKKNPAHLTQPSKRQKTSLARRQGGESRRLSTGQLGDGVGSARVHNLCSLEAVRLVGVEVLITHTPPQLDNHEDQDEQHEHRRADEQQQVELGFSEVEHGSARLSALFLRHGHGNRPDHLRGEVLASYRSLNSIPNGVWEFVWPLTDGRSGDADCFGGGRHCAAEQLNGLFLVHAADVSALTARAQAC